MAVQIPQLKTIGAPAPESQPRANFQAPDYSRAAAIDQRTVSGVLNTAQQFAENVEKQTIEEKSTDAQTLMAKRMSSDLQSVKNFIGDPTQKFASMRDEWSKYKDELMANNYSEMDSFAQSQIVKSLDKTMSHYEIQSSLEESRHYNAWKDQNLQDFTKLTGDSLMSMTQLFQPNQKDSKTGEALPLTDAEGKVRVDKDGKPLYVDPNALDKFNAIMNDNLEKVVSDLRSKGLGPKDATFAAAVRQLVDANVAPAIKATTGTPDKEKVTEALMKEWGGLMSEKAKADIFKTGKTNDLEHRANVALQQILDQSNDVKTQSALVNQIRDPDLVPLVRSKLKAKVTFDKGIEDYSMAKADNDMMRAVLDMTQTRKDSKGNVLPPAVVDFNQVQNTPKWKELVNKMSPKGRQAVQAAAGKRPTESDPEQMEKLQGMLKDGTFYQMDYGTFMQESGGLSKLSFTTFSNILTAAAKNPEARGMMSHLTDRIEAELAASKQVKYNLNSKTPTAKSRLLIDKAYFTASQYIKANSEKMAGMSTAQVDDWVHNNIKQLASGQIMETAQDSRPKFQAPVKTDGTTSKKTTETPPTVSASPAEMMKFYLDSGQKFIYGTTTYKDVQTFWLSKHKGNEQ